MMKKIAAGKLALSLMMGLTLLSGCGSSAGADGEVAVNLASEPPQMTSFLTTDIASGTVLRHLVVGLTTLDENDQAVPGIAQSWEVNGNTYTWKLRKDAKWNNGDPVTAHDFEFAFDELFRTSNGSGYASTWAAYVEGAEAVMAATSIDICPIIADEKDLANAKWDEESGYYVDGENHPIADQDKNKVDEYGDPQYEACAQSDAEAKEQEKAIEAAYANKGWKALDDYTFEVTYTGPYPYIPDLMAFYSFLPLNEKLYEEYGGLKGYGQDADKIACNGAFTIAAWTHEDSIVLEKNENYYDKDKVKLNKIEFKMIQDSAAALNAFENGDLDMVGLNGEQYRRYAEEGKTTYAFDDGGNWYFQFNTTKKPFNNRKVRKAMTLGIDVQTYIDTVILDDSKAGQSFTTPAVQNGEFYEKVGELYDRSNKDFTDIKAMLEEGLKEEGMSLADFKPVLLGDVGDSALKMYAFFQEQWRVNLGVDVEIDQVEFKTRLERMDTQQFDVVLARWSLDYNDPMTYLDLWLTDGGNNQGKYSNPEYDALITGAFKESDPAKREAMLIEAEKIIAEDMPAGIINYSTRNYVTSERLKGVGRSAFRDIDLRFAETSSVAK